MLEFYTNAEIEADHLLALANVYSTEAGKNNITKSAEYILALADRIKNQRANMTMQLAGNRGTN